MSSPLYYSSATDPLKAFKLEVEQDDASYLWDEILDSVVSKGHREFESYKDATTNLWQRDPIYHFKFCEVVLRQMREDWEDEDLEDLAERVDNYRSEQVDVCWKINSQGQWERLIWNNLESQHLGHRNLDFDRDWSYRSSLVDILEQDGRDAFWQEIMRRVVAGGEDEFALLDNVVRVNCWKELEDIKRDAIWQPEWVALTRSYDQHFICERDHPQMKAIWMPDYLPTPEQAQSFVSEMNQIASGEVYGILIDGEHTCGGFVMDYDDVVAEAKQEFLPDDIVEITEIQYAAIVFLRDLEENKTHAESVVNTLTQGNTP